MRRSDRRTGAAACAVALALACALSLAAAAAGGEADPDAVRALRAVADVRGRLDAAPAATVDGWRALTWRGRPALEIKGRAAGAAGPGPVRDFAIYDLGSGRIALFVHYPHASTRAAGEPILSLGEVSSRADAHARALLPGAELALESIQRYRASGRESVYYEAAFVSPGDEVPFLQPPVRLLLDASTGSLFRFDAEPEWLARAKPPAARLSRQAAERVAAASLGARDLAPALGAGAVLAQVAAAELFVVRPNDWLALPGEERPAGARVAWVVPFTLAAGSTGGAHRLFVDAETGRVLGGLPGAR